VKVFVGVEVLTTLAAVGAFEALQPDNHAVTTRVKNIATHRPVTEGVKEPAQELNNVFPTVRINASLNLRELIPQNLRSKSFKGASQNLF
jgi:hypothetical protein